MASDDKIKEHPFVCTIEQVIGLAPDKYHIRTSRGFAVPEKWTELGRTDDLIWGIFPIKGKPSLSVSVRLNQLSLNCSCKSRKYPCNHLLSILLLYAELPESFSNKPIPESLAHLVDQFEANQKSVSPKRGADLKRRNQRRRENITAGLLELELWLHDMIENGLAAAQDYPKTYWTAMADRLVDYQIGEVAQQIRAMGQLPGKEVNWHETLLQQASQLYLLVQGFKRYDELPLTMQMDLRMAVGWLPRHDEVDSHAEASEWEQIHDSWLVLGKRTELRGKQSLQRTWLWGEQTNRPALLLDVVTRSRRGDLTHIVGSSVDATLHFAPTTTKLFALMESADAVDRSVPLKRQQGKQFVTGYGSVHEAITHYRNAIAQNPWLRYAPVALSNVTLDSLQIDRTDKSWGVRDRFAVQTETKEDEYLLPLPQKFDQLWHLRSLGHHNPLAIFGEWNGEVFTPLSIWKDERLLETRVLGGSN